MNKKSVLLIFSFLFTNQCIIAQWVWHPIWQWTLHEGIATIEDEEPFLHIVKRNADSRGGLNFIVDWNFNMDLYPEVEYFAVENKLLLNGNYEFDINLPEISDHSDDAPFTIDLNGRSGEVYHRIRIDQNEIQTFEPLYLNRHGGDLSIGNNDVFLESNGDRLGIGTDTPSGYHVSIAGNDKTLLLDAPKPQLILVDDLDEKALIKSENQNMYFQNLENGISQFGSDTHGMTINKTGDIGINTELPEAAIHVQNNVSELLRLENYGDDYTSMAFYHQGARKGYMVNTDGNMFYINSANGSTKFTNLGTDQFTLDNDGNLGIANPSPNYTLDVNGDGNFTGELTAASDRKFKKDILPLTNASQNLLQLNPVHYNFRTEEYPDLHLSKKKRYGLIAQEVEAVFPQLVSNDAKKTTSDQEEKDYKSINYIDLIPLLLKGLQEQQLEITQLNALLDTYQQKG